MKKEDSEIHIFFIFWGPSEAGKTTALEYIYNNVPFLKKGELIKIEDEKGSTMMFDFVPFVILPEDEKSKVQVLFHCYTVPGQEQYSDRRAIVLEQVKYADGFIFVADSQMTRIKDNLESYKELKKLTKKILGKEIGKDLPMVVFINKRDLPNAAPVYLIKKIFDHADAFFETVAPRGIGIIEGFKKISELVLLRLLRELGEEEE